MKTKLTLFIFLFLPVFLFAQNKKEYREYNRYHFKHIEWNGQTFDNNLRGINMLMEDIEKVDPLLHLILEKDYKKFKSRKRDGRIIIGTGVLVSSGFMLGIALESLAHGDDEPAGMAQKRVDNLLLGSLASLSIGAIVGGIMLPNTRKFIYDFTQRINENTNIRKVKYTLRPDISLGNNSFVGLSFSLKF